MLTTNETKGELQEQKPSISHLLYICEISKVNPQGFFTFQDEVNYWKKHNNLLFNGLLINSENYIIHLVEGSTETLYHLVKLTEDLIKKNSTYFSGLTFPIFIQKISRTLFKNWTIISCEPFKNNEEDLEKYLPEVVSWSLYYNLVDIGSKYGHLNSLDICKEIMKMPRIKKLFLKQKILKILLSDKFPSLQDFIEVYVSPIDICVDSEMMWQEGLVFS
ncbi:hypothetical protein SteCoe_15675 [Stentor coeruleus]|uniref:BLUF domain-containing protein n=1 Tax=Stentor coeruleus TaxID=5963 RepID=A0A1R2C318_9CILI|nr:hypothetical protein SteCoe_15675 [Stentor coeruleus]